MAMEYAGYGIYWTKESSEAQILADAVWLYDFITTEYGFNESDIILFGRSIGSGPATYVASVWNPSVLILMSPFKSIKEVVKGLMGRMIKWLVAEWFDNLKHMESVKCPVMFIHGLGDDLIARHHSEDLHAKVANISQIIIHDEMDHNNFDFHEHLVDPVKEFMKKLGIFTNKNLELK